MQLVVISNVINGVVGVLANHAPDALHGSLALQVPGVLLFRCLEVSDLLRGQRLGERHVHTGKKQHGVFLIG